MSLQDRCTAHCDFSTSDNSDGTFWIFVSPQGTTLKLGDRKVGIALNLKQRTSMADADDLANQLRKHVANVTISYE
jgi:hypothetical protein